MHGFDFILLLLGLILALNALLSGLAARSLLSLTVLSVLAGFALGEGGLGVVELDPLAPAIQHVAVVALIVILFRDGLEVDQRLLRSDWHLPLRKLLLGMPITGALIGLACHYLIGMDWLESFLVGALLSPTDPVLSAAVINNPKVPFKIRQSLNLESGLNDGLALPAVVALAAAITVRDEAGSWVALLARDVGLGLVVGVGVGLVAARVLPEHARRLPEHATSMFGLGTALTAYGLAIAVHGNGFIAVFLSALLLGMRRGDIALAFEHRSEDIVELVKTSVFLIFGALLSWELLTANGWGGLGLALFTFLVARPLAMLVSLSGSRLSLGSKLFMGWFGPRGIASMVFALLVLSDPQIAMGKEIFSLIGTTVFLSILLHSSTDVWGARWIARHARRHPELDDQATSAVSGSEADAGSKAPAARPDPDA